MSYCAFHCWDTHSDKKKATRGGKSLSRWLTLPHRSSSVRGVRPCDACWFATPSWYSLLSHTTEDHLLVDGTAHSELGPPLATINRGKCCLGMVYTIPQLRESSFQLTLICFK